MKKTIPIVLLLFLAGFVQAQPVMPTGPFYLESYDMPGWYMTCTDNGSSRPIQLIEGKSPEALWLTDEPFAGTGTISLTPVSQPGNYARHAGWIMYTDPSAEANQYYNNDASWYARAGLANPDDPSLVSFENNQYANNYIQHNSDGDPIGFGTGGGLTVPSGEEGRATFRIVLPNANIAFDPEPTNTITEIPLDQILKWKVPYDDTTQTLYFGTDADLTDAIVIEDLANDVNSYDPGKLEYGTTYYWRVDEVNDTVNTGALWSFTTILEGYPILPAEIIEVTASGSYQGEDPNNTCTGLGLDANDLHSALAAEMWASQTSIAADDCWIQYEFDKIYKLHDVLIWNYNEAASKIIGGKEVRIETSMDGETWTDLAGVITLNQASGTPGYAANNTVAFEGIAAKYVKIIFVSNFSGFLPFYGLSEVRFSAIPTRAANYSPADEEEDVAVLADLSWSAGRDVDEHYLYLSTDMNAVAEATADPIILDEASTTQELILAQTYYMRVDEVNDAEDYPVWDGPVTSFTSVDTIVVDNFEDYNESDEGAVWVTWLSGYDSADYGGSYMGHEAPPYVEEDIVHGGDQSAPMVYDNTGDYDFSEVVAQVSDLAAGTDWTIGSPTTLTIWFSGDPCNVVGEDQLYCEIDGEKVVYSGDFNMFVDKDIWMPFDIDLSALGIDLEDVSELTIGIEKAGATGSSGVLYIDDIYLSGFAPVVAEAPIIIEAEDYVNISAPMEVNDVLAGASGGQYIQPAAGTDASRNNPPDPGVATYEVNLTAGQYILYARVSITGGFGGDAFWVRVNGATSDRTLHASGWAEWNGIPGGEEWHWDDVHVPQGYGAGPAITWTVPEDSTITIDIAYRDTTDEPKIDTLMLVKVGD